MKTWKFDALWVDGTWKSPAFVQTDASGCVVSISDRGTATERPEPWAIPAFQNAHSHAFQYAMAGLAEHIPANAKGDDFWSWRDSMYSLAESITPERLEEVAYQLYCQMIRVGYSSVVEFHYIHHQPDGAPHSDPAEMGKRICQAAKRAGIHLTLVPMYYQTGGFGQPASPQQKRFISKSIEQYWKLFEATKKHTLANGFLIGVGVHSLRAAPANDVISLFASAPVEIPKHLHIAEQQREVGDCIKALGKRPVDWLLDNVEVNETFHLVHATHINEAESQKLAKSRANVVLCPTTEANLGDGIFPLMEFHQAGGSYSIGTDSHIGLNPLEELRLLEYGQRLKFEKRNVLCQSGEDTGELLFSKTLTAGALARGLKKAPLSIGSSFDVVVLDSKHHLLSSRAPERRLSTLIFGNCGDAVKKTIIRGESA